MARHKDKEWNLPIDMDWSRVNLALLMDIRDELNKLNRLLHCSNAVRIPRILDAIKRNTVKRKRKARKL